MVSHRTLFCDTISAARHRFFSGFFLTGKKDLFCASLDHVDHYTLVLIVFSMVKRLQLIWKSAQTNRLVSYLQTNN